MSNPAKAYLATQVETTTQGELLLMLYEAAIKFMKRAKIEIEKKDYAQKGIYISKAIAVISELADSLNKEKGGEITQNLHGLYLFCNFHLSKANINMDTTKIDEVIKIIDGIRSAYAQVVPMVEKGISAEAAKNQAAATKPVKPSAPTASPAPQPAPAAPPVPTQAPEQTPPQQATVQPAPPKPTVPQQTAPKPMVNPARLRATNAYSNNR